MLSASAFDSVELPALAAQVIADRVVDLKSPVPVSTSACSEGWRSSVDRQLA